MQGCRGRGGLKGSRGRPFGICGSGEDQAEAAAVQGP